MSVADTDPDRLLSEIGLVPRGRDVFAGSSTAALTRAAGADGEIPAPSRALLAAETRAVAELAGFHAMKPFLRRAPRGDGHAVIVLPGFIASDLSTGPMRTWLAEKGYDVHRWRMGSNLGPTHAVMTGLKELLRHARRKSGRKVSVIGWSLGGVYAREIARDHPDDVRQVITMGSPIAAARAQTNASTLFEVLSPFYSHKMDAIRARMHEPPPVPVTAIYSTSDGIVPWPASLEQPGPNRENIRVAGSHCGLGFNPLALWAVADRLAQAEDTWRPYRQTSPLRRLATILAGTA